MQKIKFAFLTFVRWHSSRTLSTPLVAQAQEL